MLVTKICQRVLAGWYLQILSVGILVAALLMPVAGWGAADPRQVIQDFSQSLLAVMKGGPKLGFGGRVERLRGPVTDAYDLPAMTRDAVGPAAAQMTPDEMKHLTEAFARYTVASYADQFNSWHGEQFKVGAPHPSTDSLMVVPSQIVPASGSPTEIDYVMHKDRQGQWKIVDVLLEGTVSQLAVRRSEFMSVYRRDGLAGLINLLDSKTAAMGRG